MHADSLTLQFCLISDKVFLCRLLLLQAAQRQITQNLPLQSVNPHLDQSLFTRCAAGGDLYRLRRIFPKVHPLYFHKIPAVNGCERRDPRAARLRSCIPFRRSTLAVWPENIHNHRVQAALHRHGGGVYFPVGIHIAKLFPPFQGHTDLADGTILSHGKAIHMGTAVALLYPHLFLQGTGMVSDIPVVLKAEHTVVVIAVQAV